MANPCDFGHAVILRDSFQNSLGFILDGNDNDSGLISIFRQLLDGQK